jgi:hypothetical protein
MVAGIITQPYLDGYRTTGSWNHDGLVGYVLFALITGVVIFPSVYRNAFDSAKPLVVQLAAIFAAGMGWQTLLGTAARATAEGLSG